jgi:hypothetical protein
MWCFYCEVQLPYHERFVYCQTCYGFISCRNCWEGPTNDDVYHRQRKAKLLRQPDHDERWPSLDQHFFTNEHADWGTGYGMTLYVRYMAITAEDLLQKTKTAAATTAAAAAAAVVTARVEPTAMVIEKTASAAAVATPKAQFTATLLKKVETAKVQPTVVQKKRKHIVHLESDDE